MSRVKRNKTKFKMTKQFVCLIAFIVILIALAIILIQPSQSERIYNSYAEAASSTDTALSNDHVFVKVSLNSLEKKIKKNNDEYLYVYYGMPSCVNCVTNIETFNAAAKNFEVEKVYYLSATIIEKYDPDDEKDANKIAAMEAKVGFDLLEYPSLIVYKNGKIVFNSNDYKDESTQQMVMSWKAIAYQAFGGEF